MGKEVYGENKALTEFIRAIKIKNLLEKQALDVLRKAPNLNNI